MFPALIAAFIVVPIIEIYTLIRVGQWIGLWPTIVLLLLDGFAGAWLVKHEGRRTWTAFNDALRAGRFPGKEVGDGALVLVGGTLLVTPGFVTDVVGVFFLLPPTRALARRLLMAVLRRRYGILGMLADSVPTRPAPQARGDVLSGDVIGGDVIDGVTVQRPHEPPRSS